MALLLLGLHCQSWSATTPEELYLRIERSFALGELTRANAELDRAGGAIAQSGPEWRERFLLLKAKVLLYQGQAGQARDLLNQPSVSTADSAIARDTLLALAYWRTNDEARAQSALSRAEHDPGDDRARASVLIASGVIDMERGRLDDSEHSLRLAYAKAEKADDRLQKAQSLLDLGVVALRKEHYEDALSLFEESAASSKSIGARLASEKTIGGVGSTYFKMGDYTQAIAKARDAEKEARTLGASIDEVGWLNDIGLSEFRLGQLTQARSSYEHSLKLATAIGNHEEIANAQVALGYLYLQTDPSVALRFARQALGLATLRLNEPGMFQPLLLEARALAAEGQNEDARAKLLALEQRVQAKPSVRWEVESTAARLYNAAGDRLGAGQWFQKAIDTYDRQRSSFHKVESKLPFSENGSDLYLAYMEQLISEGRTDEALAVLDRSRAETLTEGLGILHGNANKPDRALAPTALAGHLGGTILVFCLRPDTSYLWASNAKRTQFYRLPGRATILALVEKHREAILNGQEILANTSSPGRALYDALIAPAQSMIEPGAKVFLIGDQGLHRLNFETLVAPSSDQKNHFFIEDATITNAASLSVLAQRKPRPALAGQSLLLIGDPIAGSGGHAELVNASREVASIAHRFTDKQRVVLTGPLATPGAYASHEPARFTYIHFVAHGTASEANPLDSAVILSPPSGKPEAYKLYARTILDRHINADLVTISACYGSGARAYAGEGLVGLAWAFLRAGSHNVIGSLWEISDASTPELMANMYDQLGAGATPDVALRSAKLAMLHRGDLYHKPLYWAPFQLYAGT